MTKRLRFVAVAAALVVVAPLCGSLMALLCPADCCCGETAMDPCQGEECITSPAAVPVQALGAVVDAPATEISATRSVKLVADRKPATSTAPASHSPPDLYLRNSFLLI